MYIYVTNSGLKDTESYVLIVLFLFNFDGDLQLMEKPKFCFSAWETEINFLISTYQDAIFQIIQMCF